MLESLDNGKPFAIARAADVPLAADLFRYMAGWPTKIEGTTIPISALPAPGEYLAYTLREPVGVVGQIIPWNFPLLMAAWKLGPALACGCTVVLKPAEQTPLSALRLGELLQEAGLPDGVVNIVTGFGDAGAALAAHDDVDKVAFTGSTEVGKLIVKAAAGNLKKVSLELGGKSPNVVFADADLEAAIPGAANAIFFNHGQCCNAGSRLYVQKQVFDDVVAGVAEHGQEDQGRPGHRPRLADGPADLRRAVREGARLPRRPGSDAGAEAVVGGGRAGDRGYFVQPTVLTNTNAGHEGRARGDLRAGRVRDPVRLARRDRRRSPTTPTTASPRACSRATSRKAHRTAKRLRAGHGVDQHLPRVRRRDAVRRLQGVRLGARDGPRRCSTTTSRRSRSSRPSELDRDQWPPSARLGSARAGRRLPARRRLCPVRHPAAGPLGPRVDPGGAARLGGRDRPPAPPRRLVRRAPRAGRRRPSASGCASTRAGRAARAWPPTSAPGARRSRPPACPRGA